MKSKLMRLFALLGLTVAIFCWMGVGYYSSSSAVRDLRTELEAIYGMEYTGKEADNGTEDMAFRIEPKTWFMTNWNLRNALSIDYKYECNVIFTTYADGDVKSVRTITYQAVDPMGAARVSERAHVSLESKVEKVENN